MSTNPGNASEGIDGSSGSLLPAAIVFLAVRAFAVAVEHHNDGISRRQRGIVSVGNQQPVVHDERILRSVFFSEISLFVRARVPRGHVNKRLRLDTRSLFAVTERLAFIEIVEGRCRNLCSDVECAIRHRRVIQILLSDLRTNRQLKSKRQ